MKHQKSRTTLALLLGVSIITAANLASAQLDASLVLRPKNYRPYQASHKELVGYGKQLFKDPKLSTNGSSCNSCHVNHGAFQAGFSKPYPHPVAMAKDKLSISKIHLDEMVQACMVIPMSAKPLPWNSKELAALTAYTSEIQKNFVAGKATPNP